MGLLKKMKSYVRAHKPGNRSNDEASTSESNSQPNTTTGVHGRKSGNRHNDGASGSESNSQTNTTPGVRDRNKSGTRNNDGASGSESRSQTNTTTNGAPSIANIAPNNMRTHRHQISSIRQSAFNSFADETLAALNRSPVPSIHSEYDSIYFKDDEEADFYLNHEAPDSVLGLGVGPSTPLSPTTLVASNLGSPGAESHVTAADPVNDNNSNDDETKIQESAQRKVQLVEDRYCESNYDSVTDNSSNDETRSIRTPNRKVQVVQLAQPEPDHDSNSATEASEDSMAVLPLFSHPAVVLANRWATKNAGNRFARRPTASDPLPLFRSDDLPYKHTMRHLGRFNAFERNRQDDGVVGEWWDLGEVLGDRSSREHETLIEDIKHIKHLYDRAEAIGSASNGSTVGVDQELRDGIDAILELFQGLSSGGDEEGVSRLPRVKRTTSF